MFCKADVLLEEAVENKLVVEGQLDEVVRLIMEEDNSFPEPPRVLADAIDRTLPVLNQLDHEPSQLPQVRHRFEHRFQFVLPAFTTVLLFLLPSLCSLFLLDGQLSPHSLQALLDIQLCDGSNLSSQVGEANFSGFNCLFYHVVGVLFSGHMLNFGQEQLMHS